METRTSYIPGDGILLLESIDGKNVWWKVLAVYMPYINIHREVTTPKVMIGDRVMLHSNYQTKRVKELGDNTYLIHDTYVYLTARDEPKEPVQAEQEVPAATESKWWAVNLLNSIVNRGYQVNGKKISY